MSAQNHYDVIIIGTGAGGGTLAYKIAPSGKKILLLERGDYVPREKDNWSTRAVNLEGKYNTKETWYDSKGEALHPHTNYFVGGNTKFYGAALFRLRREDFGELKHHGGISPAWPISYEELEPYYTKAEYLYQVHGNRGEDPTEPFASAPYRYPAVSHEQRLQHLSDDLERAGLKPFHVPLGIRIDEKNTRTSLCIRCNTCDGHPCLIGAKSDAQTICVDPALEHKNVSLITNANVMRLETNGNAREVSKVIVKRHGEIEEYSGNIVVASCGAVNSAALLLRSANDSHPNGLANGSDVVGRHYMGHINSVLMALSKCPNPTIFQKTLAINDFYFRGPHTRYPLGQIQSQGRTHGVMAQTVVPQVPVSWYDWWVARGVDWLAMSEDLPDTTNRVAIDASGRIQLLYRPNNLKAHRMLVRETRRILRKLGFWVVMTHSHGAKNTTHQCGTLVFGTNPRESVLDPYCRAHDIGNLFVVDASFFPSSAAVNPALTIAAQALRVADHMRTVDLKVGTTPVTDTPVRSADL